MDLCQIAETDTCIFRHIFKSTTQIYSKYLFANAGCNCAGSVALVAFWYGSPMIAATIAEAKGLSSLKKQISQSQGNTMTGLGLSVLVIRHKKKKLRYGSWKIQTKTFPF